MSRLRLHPSFCGGSSVVSIEGCGGSVILPTERCGSMVAVDSVLTFLYMPFGEKTTEK